MSGALVCDQTRTRPACGVPLRGLVGAGIPDCVRGRRRQCHWVISETPNGFHHFFGSFLMTVICLSLSLRIKPPRIRLRMMLPTISRVAPTLLAIS